MGHMGDLVIIYPKPYSIYLRGTICTVPRLLIRGCQASRAYQACTFSGLSGLIELAQLLGLGVLRFKA